MAVLRHVETGTTTLAAGSATRTVNLTTTLLDRSKAFMLFSMQPSDAAPQFGQVRGQLISTTQLQFDRATAASSPTINIRYYIAEFISGVSVQWGSTSVDLSVPQQVTISAVDLTKTLVIVSHSNGGNDYDRNDHLWAKLTSTTNLQLDMTSNGGFAEWQVVQFTSGASVQTADFTLATTESSKTAAVTGATGGLLTFTYKHGTTGAIKTSEGLIRGRITSNTQLTFDRPGWDGSGPVVTGTYYLVTFTDGTIVQEKLPSFGTADTQIDTTITAVNANNCIVFSAGDFNRCGVTNYGTDDNPGPTTFTFELTSSTNLRTVRGITGSATADVTAYVVQFAEVAMPEAMHHYRRRRQ